MASSADSAAGDQRMATAGHQLPRALLLDMDGTLVDTEHVWLAAEHEVMAKLGTGWTEADQRLCLGGPLDRVTGHMRQRSGTHLSDADIGELLMDAMERRLRTEPPAWQPGARAIVEEARERDVPMALVSASWSRLIGAVAEEIARDLGTSPFTVVVAGDDVENSKPHPEPYLTASRLLSAIPGECLALEDSPTGITSARDAGCRVIAIPHLAPVDHLGTAVITTLSGHTIATLWELAGSG